MRNAFLKRLLLMGAMFVSGSLNALASDLPETTAEPSASQQLDEPNSWVGWYLGAYGADNWLSSQKGLKLPGASVNYSDHGIGRVGGGTWAGYMFAMPGSHLLYGLEAGVGYTNGKAVLNKVETASWMPAPGGNGSQKNGFGGEFRARAGILSFDDEVLFYAVAGFVGARFDTNAHLTFADGTFLSSEKKRFESGATVGLGAEGRIYGPLTLRAEYTLQEYFGIKTTSQEARLGLGYHF